jgi:XTP/dITP diphosphohydrolase
MRIQNVSDRTAQFKCVMVLISPQGEETVSEGVLKGKISEDMRGKWGFGYDPVFVPENETKTLAELGLATKNRLSHRALALRNVRTVLEGVLARV